MNWDEIREEAFKIPNVIIYKNIDGEFEFSFDTPCEDDGIRVVIIKLNPKTYTACIGSVSINFGEMHYSNGTSQIVFTRNNSKIVAKIDLSEED